MKTSFIAGLIFLFIYPFLDISPIYAQTDEEIGKYTRSRDERLSWWREARYGMFIHWGVYAELAGSWQGKRINGPGEWIMYHAKIPVTEYEKIAYAFNPVEFDAGEWVKIASDAGMKYIVITAKHCDGFAMFDSETSQYNILNTPFGRDPMMELKKACEREGLKFGFYYSHNWDWHEPNALGLDNNWDFPDREIKKPDIYYHSKSIPQIRELMKKYDPDILWFDVPTDISREISYEILKTVREINPECIINDRISSEHQEQILLMGDFSTPEQYIPDELDLDFETCMTLNDTWGYKYYDHNWKSPQTIIKQLALNAGLGGNYLLNVGPDKLGNIPMNSAMILKTAGKWLLENGEGIYGTSSCPLEHVFYDKATCTEKPGKLYIHLFEWPDTDELLLGEINAEVDRVYFLSGGASISFRQTTGNDLILNLDPAEIGPGSISNIINTIVIEYSGVLQPQEKPFVVDPFSTAVLKPSKAEYNGNASYAFNNKWGEHRGYEMTEWYSGGTISWEFRTIRAGSYKIALIYGADEGSQNNEVMLLAGGKSFRHKIEAHRGWYVPEVVEMGEISIEAGTTGKIEISALTGSTGCIANFMELRLIPVSGTGRAN